jgi:protoporphyrinogen oxidase
MELSIYLLLLILLAPVEPRREIHPVIVIGAGVSGLRAS